MAKKKINELTSKTAMLNDNDFLMVYDSEEAGSEQTKKVPISSHISVVGSDLDIYVATTGSDVTGTGTSGNPFGSIQGALDYLENKHINTNAEVTINLADGTYNSQPNFIVKRILKVNIVGNISTPANVTLNFASGASGLRFQEPTYAFVNGVKLVGFAKSEWKAACLVQWGGTLYARNIIVDNWGVGFQAYYNSFMFCANATANNNNYGVHAVQHSGISFDSGSITNNASFGVGSEILGRIAYNTGVTFSGNTSNTYNATGGLIQTYS